MSSSDQGFRCICGQHKCYSAFPLDEGPSVDRHTQQDNRCQREDMDCSRRAQQQERYLMARGAPPVNGRCWDQANEDELLHVLVTRPEIAGKPRDNIVFEGDMDLKTTFETSYEALAKMRLDCWRRHQELVNTGGCRVASTGSTCGLGPATDIAERKASGGHQQQVVSVAVERQSMGLDEAEEGGHDNGLELQSSDELAKIRKNHQHVSDWDSSNQSEGARVDAAVQVDLAGPSPATLQPSTWQHQQQQQQIDPDLTPIIVYDANMNRLERVGLRKRSKYRPSTSLRPGARGLFGDGEPGRSICERGANCQTQSISRGQAGATREDMLPKHNDTLDYQSHPLTSRTPGTESSSRATNMAIDARNLKDSQPHEYLLYSEANLHVDRKRKLKDNVNMIDHIREQDQGRIDEMAGAVKQGEVDQQALESKCQIVPVEEAAGLVDHEEAAAIEELRKVRENCVDSPDLTVSEGKDMTERKSRLKRTCQNQNFDIYNNEYHEAEQEVALKPAIERGMRTTPQSSRVYTNLFRESPDFMQATGRLVDQRVDASEMNKMSANI